MLGRPWEGNLNSWVRVEIPVSVQLHSNRLSLFLGSFWDPSMKRTNFGKVHQKSRVKVGVFGFHTHPTDITRPSHKKESLYLSLPLSPYLFLSLSLSLYFLISWFSMVEFRTIKSTYSFDITIYIYLPYSTICKSQNSPSYKPTVDKSKGHIIRK